MRFYAILAAAILLTPSTQAATTSERDQDDLDRIAECLEEETLFLGERLSLMRAYDEKDARAVEPLRDQASKARATHQALQNAASSIQKRIETSLALRDRLAARASSKGIKSYIIRLERDAFGDIERFVETNNMALDYERRSESLWERAATEDRAMADELVGALEELQNQRVENLRRCREVIESVESRAGTLSEPDRARLRALQEAWSQRERLLRESTEG